MQLSKILSIIASVFLILSPLSGQAIHIINAGTAEGQVDCSNGSLEVILTWSEFTEFGEPYQWQIHRNNVLISSTPERVNSSTMTYRDTNPLADGISVNEYEIVGSVFGGGYDHYYTYSAGVPLVCPSAPPPPPAPATISITPDRAMSWNINGSPILCPTYGLCYSDYAGQTRSYSFDATSDPVHTVSAYAASANVVGYSLSPLKKLASKFFNFVTASSGSGGSCNSSPGGSCNINLTTTNCTVNVVGYWNGSGNIPTNAYYTLSGPASTSGTNSSGNNSHTLMTDAGGSSYTFNSSAYTSNINGYASDAYYSSSTLTCFPGWTITFNIISQSQPILDVR